MSVPDPARLSNGLVQEQAMTASSMSSPATALQPVADDGSSTIACGGAERTGLVATAAGGSGRSEPISGARRHWATHNPAQNAELLEAIGAGSSERRRQPAADPGADQLSAAGQV